MTNGIGEKPLLFSARIAGFSILFMGVAGIVANLFMTAGLIVPDDEAITANNITANDLFMRLGNFSFLIMLILDLVVAWALYILLKRVNKNVALLAALFRIVYTAVFAVGLFYILGIVQLLSEDAHLGGVEADQLGFEVMMHINAVNNAWTIGLVFFGVHLLIVGYLLFKSGFIPKILGILMLIAGLGYIIDNILLVLIADYVDLMAIVPLIVLVLSVMAELSLAIWLLVKGKNLPERIS